MANEALRMDLFGPSPAEVMQARQGQNYDQAMAWGQVDPLKSGQISGAMAGQAFGQALGGVMGGQDPAYEKAQRMQMAQMETEEFARANGIDLATKPQDYYKLATQTLSKYGLANEAAQVAEIARRTALQEREMVAKERGVDIDALSARAAWVKANAAGTSNKSIVTLVPPGTNQKTGEGARTYNLSIPEENAAAIEAMRNGHIDVSKLPSPPSPGAIVNNYPPEDKKFLEKAGEQAAMDLFKQRATVRAVPEVTDKALRTLAILEDLNLVVGPGADVRLALAKGLNILGADNAETITQTDNLVTALADNTLSMIESSGLGTGQGFTQSDRDYLEKARAGKITLTKETIAEVARRTIKGQRYYVENWNKQMSILPPRLRDDLRGLGVDTEPVPLPEIPAAKKYKTKEQALQNVPAGIDPETWKYMPDDKKALFLRGN